MLGIGRFGGILGALAGGPLLSAGYSIGYILSLLALPACAAGAALLLQSWLGTQSLRAKIAILPNALDRPRSS